MTGRQRLGFCDDKGAQLPRERLTARAPLTDLVPFLIKFGHFAEFSCIQPERFSLKDAT